MSPRRSIALALALALVMTLQAMGSPTRAATAVTVRIVSSLPRGPQSAPLTRGIEKAIQLAVDEAAPASGVRIEYRPLDDGDDAGNWQPDVEAQRARDALADASVVAYIGPFNSGAARISIPILCAGHLAMVSPSNTYPGLTRPGFETDEPERYYPSCPRNYARVIDDDDVQGGVAARWALSLGARSAYVLTPDAAFARGLAGGFRAEAAKIGLREAGFEVVALASSQADLAARIIASGSDVVYFSGNAGGPAIVVRDLRAAGSHALFVSSSVLPGSDYPGQAGSAGAGTLATLWTWNASDFHGRALAFRVRYATRYGEDPTPYAIYGYDAARAAIAAIRAAGQNAADRATVRDRLMATRHFNGALGCWSFDRNGDTSFATNSTVILVGGQWRPAGDASLGMRSQGCERENEEGDSR